MTETLKDRPAQLVRRAPRPAPDEKVDPVDYSPATAASPPTSEETVAAPATPEPAKEETPEISKTEPSVPQSELTESGKSKIAKATPNKKSARREVTFPLSTRISQEVMDILYTAVEEEGITVREAIEIGIKHRWR